MTILHFVIVLTIRVYVMQVREVRGRLLSYWRRQVLVEAAAEAFPPSSSARGPPHIRATLDNQVRVCVLITSSTISEGRGAANAAHGRGEMGACQGLGLQQQSRHALVRLHAAWLSLAWRGLKQLSICGALATKR